MRALTLTILLLILASAPIHAATYHVSQAAANASDDDAGTLDAPWLTVNKAAQTLVAGDKVIVHAGTYREHVDPQNSGAPGAPIIYEAAEGEEVILTGADIVTGWERVPGDRAIYSAPWPHKFIINHIDGVPLYHHPGDAKHVRSGRPEQVIVDGEVWDSPELVLSLDEMTERSFFPDVDAEKLYIWLPDDADPSDHEIQGSARQLIFGTNPWRKNTFDHTHVRGFIFRYGATFAQRPSVWLIGKHNLVEDCLIEWMCGGGVGVGPEGGILRRCVIRNCGHVGGCAKGTNFVNEDCVWEGNSRKPIARVWDAGGVKITGSHHGIFQRCVFKDNGGPGLWLDIDVADVVIRNCLFDGNEEHGLFIEISRDIYVMNNAFFRNGLRAEGFVWAVGGLSLGESQNCVLTHNLVVGNRDGIVIREQGPRYLDTNALGQIRYVNSGHVIANNISANNAGYQLALYYDSAWFGMHPGQKDDFDSEEAFTKHITEEDPDRWFDPLARGIAITRNVCWAEDDQKLYLYGVPWRARHQEFDSVDAFTEATGFGVAGQVIDPGLVELTPDHFTLPVESDLYKQGYGPRFPVPPAP